MKIFKASNIVFGLLVAVFVLSACSAGSSAEADFPTGRFSSSSERFISYEFNEDKTWAYLDAGAVQASGTYDVKDNQWIENGTDECPYPGTYEYTFDGTNLSFKLVGEDECAPRKSATDGKTFVILK